MTWRHKPWINSCFLTLCHKLANPDFSLSEIIRFKLYEVIEQMSIEWVPCQTSHLTSWVALISYCGSTSNLQCQQIGNCSQICCRVQGELCNLFLQLFVYDWGSGSSRIAHCLNVGFNVYFWWFCMDMKHNKLMCQQLLLTSCLLVKINLSFNFKIQKYFFHDNPKLCNENL